METKEDFQSFILPFLGGVFGILFGYLYTLLRSDANVSYALIVGCIIGVIIGAFATKLVKIKIKSPTFLKRQRKQLSLTEATIRKYNLRRKLSLAFVETISGIILSALFILTLLIIFPLYTTFFWNKGWILIVFGWLAFVLFPWGTGIESIPRNFSLEKKYFGGSDRTKLARLKYFNHNLLWFVWKNLWSILKVEFKISIFLFVPVVPFAVAVFCIAVLCFVVWAILSILYGIIRGILALLGKTMFWSSLIVAIITVLYSWSKYGNFITHPLIAISLAFSTGIIAGGIHYLFIYPLCKWVSGLLNIMEEQVKEKYFSDVFIGVIFDEIVENPWYSAWGIWQGYHKKYFSKYF